MGHELIKSLNLRKPMISFTCNGVLFFIVEMSDSPTLNEVETVASEEVVENSNTPLKDIGSNDNIEESVTLSIDQLRQLLSNTDNKEGTNTPSQKKDHEEFNQELPDEEEPLSSDEEPDYTAAAVDSKLAKFVDNRLIEAQNKSKILTKFEKATRPINIEHTKEVRINKALYKSLSMNSRKRDADLRGIHNMNSKAINNIVKAADMVVIKGKKSGNKVFSEEEFHELHSNLINGLGLICQSSQKINARRVS